MFGRMCLRSSGSHENSCFGIESLETRRLLTAVLSNGVLTVKGTEAADVITVGKNSAGQLAVYENNVLKGTFAWGSVNSICAVLSRCEASVTSCP